MKQLTTYTCPTCGAVWLAYQRGHVPWCLLCLTAWDENHIPIEGPAVYKGQRTDFVEPVVDTQPYLPGMNPIAAPILLPTNEDDLPWD